MKTLGMAIVATVVTAGPAQAQTSAKDIGKLLITPGSASAVVILKSEVLPPPPTYKSAYRLTIQAYDPAAQTMRGGPFGGSMTFQAQPKKFVDGYMVMDVKPGTYAFLDFSRQDFWATCFNEGSLQFTVKPGEIVYLGELDARAQVDHLIGTAMATGQTSTRGNALVHFFDEKAAPRIAPADAAGLAAVAAMVKARMPGTSVAPVAAAYTPARFGTGNDLFGTQRICGGYYQKKAK